MCNSLKSWNLDARLHQELIVSKLGHVMHHLRITCPQLTSWVEVLQHAHAVPWLRHGALVHRIELLTCNLHQLQWCTKRQCVSHKLATGNHCRAETLFVQRKFVSQMHGKSNYQVSLCKLTSCSISLSCWHAWKNALSFATAMDHVPHTSLHLVNEAVIWFAAHGQHTPNISTHGLWTAKKMLQKFVHQHD